MYINTGQYRLTKNKISKKWYVYINSWLILGVDQCIDNKNLKFYLKVYYIISILKSRIISTKIKYSTWFEVLYEGLNDN